MIERITDMTDFEKEHLYALGDAFMEESGLSGKFNLEHFTETCQDALDMGVAALWVARENGKIVGAIGGLLSQCLFTGDITAIETFWFVSEDHRGKMTGPKLFMEFMHWVEEIEVKKVSFSSIVHETSDKIKEFYKKQGFRELETIYVKNI